MLSRPHKDVKVKKFDDQRWIVNTPDGRNMLVNERAAGLLAILSSEEGDVAVLEKFKKQFDLNLSIDQLEALIQTTFKGLSVLEKEEANFSGKPSYLSLKVSVLSARVAGLLASPLSYLFYPFIFWPVFLAGLMIGSVVFFSLLENGLPAISHTDLYWLPFLVGASMLVHELGHIAACRRFHVKHGAIGFGFYLIFPVVYADITQVWNSTRQQRIIANAGGIYAELIYATVLLMFYAVLREAIFSLAAVTVFVKAITELNPFFRYDGYWLLSDFTNTPNLMSRSNQALRKVISDVRTQGNIFSAIITGSIRSNAWLLGYALMNMILVTGYFAYVAIFFKSEIIHFPALLFFILKKAFFIQLTLADFPPGFLWVLGLYILVVKTCFQFAVQKLKSKTFVFNRVKKS